MKKINTTLTIISLILLCTLVSFVGCSDMMATLGNISLTIDLDTPEVEVASYILEGNLVDSNSRFTLNNIVPPRHTLTELKEGRWNLTVKAFDDQDNQIGIGTKTIDLRAGQVVDTSLLVVFGQSTPLASAFTIAGPSRNADREGTISGTTVKMEYRLASAAEDAPFTACTAGSTNLAPGSYKIRYAAAHGLQASECLTVTVPAYAPIQLTIIAPTLMTTKEYDGTNTVQGSMTVGTLSGVLSGDEVTVHAQASYDSATVSLEDLDKTITITYSISGDDALNYLEPASSTADGTIVQKQLTVSGTDIASTKVYDGSTLATVESHGTLGGKVDGEVVTVTAHPVYQDRHSGTGKLINVSYTLGGTHAGNYRAPANTSFSGAITRKALSITGTPVLQARDYDGGRMAQVTNPGSLSGVLAGDSVSMQATATYENKTVGNGKSATVSYSISGPDALNYTAPSDAFGTGDIRPKQLTVTDFNLVSTKEYDGSASSTINNVACSGMIPTDDVQVSAIATYNSSAAGTNKPITVTYTLAGDDSGNYLKPADSIATATGEITRKQLRVSGTTPTMNKVYDGTAFAAISSQGTLDGIVVGDTVTFSAVGSYNDKNASQTKTVTVVYTLAGADSANYIRPEDGTYQGVIQKYHLSVSGGTGVAITKTYDGTATAEITQEPSLVGIAAGDSVTLHTTAAYETDGAATGKKVWVYYNIDGDDKDNYVQPLTTLATDQGVINKKQLRVSGTSITSRDFDGTTTAPIVEKGTLLDVVDGDTVTFTAVANYATKTAGTNKQATVVYTIDGEDKDNYLAPVNGSLTGTIHKKVLTVKNIGVEGSKEYDGNTTINVTACTIEGIVDPALVTVQKTATFDTKQVGTGKSISVSFSLDGEDKDSYIEPSTRVVSSIGVITRKQLTVSDTLYSLTKEYDGTTHLPITSNGTLMGVIQGDDVTLSTAAGSYVSADAGTSKAFTIRYTLSGTDAANYTVNDVTGTTGIINKAVLTATVGDYTKSYGTTNPTFTVSVSGFVNGESVLTASGYNAPIASSTATTTTSAGTNSTITISGGSATNYSFNTSTGTLTINKAAISNDLAIFGGSSPKYGDVLTAIGNATLLGTPTYQWNRGGTAISGATSKTYTLTAADVGSTITVTAIADGINYEGSHTSWPTNTVSRIDGPSIDGAFSAYYPSSPATQTIINLIGFTPNLSGLEARVSLNGIQYDDYADLEIDSRGRAMILMSSSVTTSAKVQVRYKETATTDAGAVREIPITEQALAIGDYYAGGVVGYIYQSSDPGYVANELHGLIAAKTDTSTNGSKWSSNNTLRIGTGVGIGTGSANTDAIILALDGSEVGMYGAKEARMYTSGGYNDWFLPSWYELLQLRNNKFLIGNFDTNNGSTYMTSSESTQSGWDPDPYYHAVYFDNNWSNYVWDKPAATQIRAVRYF
ncbi:MAG: YDG domain-containing protein [Sphaerochaeta associata]|uniref:YDG domain-containing protein n=1 Tax=Sphaerochaeta associata TaxID=1129264 RepID=UPI002B1ECF46|nr:YDG domain-containing protein [Sphaerochaeta associata]MEA5029083.1 YDG domain-containing protein [Sphaerochaeta associata]